MNETTFADRLNDEIINYLAEDINLSDVDVKNLAISILHSIVVLSDSPVGRSVIKKSLCEIIGDNAKTVDYLNELLYGISATDDAIADELNKAEFERLENEQMEMILNGES